MSGNTYSVIHRVHTEWQWSLSGVHPIMMEKLAKPGEGGRCTPTPFHCIYHHVESCGVCFSWEGRYTPSISALSLYVPYSVVSSAALQISLCQRMKGLNPDLCNDALTWLIYNILSTNINTVVWCLISTYRVGLTTTFGKWHVATVTSIQGHLSIFFHLSALHGSLRGESVN